MYSLYLHFKNASIIVGSLTLTNIRIKYTTHIGNRLRNINVELDRALDVMDKLFQFVSKRKYLISDVITKKGISAISKDTFLTLATKIGQISEGGEDCTEGKTLIDTAIIKIVFLQVLMMHSQF